MRSRLIQQSPLASIEVKEILADRAVAAQKQMLELESGAITIEERKILHAFHGAFRRWCEMLKVAEAMDDGGPL